jgi:hypothetical protein
MDTNDLTGDLLRGARAIAQYVYQENHDRARRRVYHKYYAGGWPIWKDGADLISRKSLLNDYFTKPPAPECEKGAAP